MEWIDWPLLKRKGLQHLITGYEIPVIEVDGELGEIIEVFVRINSTGKALTRQETRHARYYRSPFLKEASRLANRFKKHFLKNGIFTAGQIDRMKHVEFTSELMLSLVQGDVLNKKTALDRVMQTNSFDGRQLRRATSLATTTLNRVCSHGGCAAKLTWDDFTIDHIDPYSRGGRSQLENAALMCRRHNSSKGNRKNRRAAA
ncbi:HNH endonuclease [Bradyrhizobium sp. Ash2021]|uniref:HNH endonuclease n=1 Tax=Bradyrhizobium sp. Ash2021 TaxID=2954771 RepID=UPI0035BF0A50